MSTAMYISTLSFRVPAAPPSITASAKVFLCYVLLLCIVLSLCSVSIVVVSLPSLDDCHSFLAQACPILTFIHPIPITLSKQAPQQALQHEISLWLSGCGRHGWHVQRQAKT